jgi:hypothetical protein
VNLFSKRFRGIVGLFRSSLESNLGLLCCQFKLALLSKKAIVYHCKKGVA